MHRGPRQGPRQRPRGHLDAVRRGPRPRPPQPTASAAPGPATLKTSTAPGAPLSGCRARVGRPRLIARRYRSRGRRRGSLAGFRRRASSSWAPAWTAGGVELLEGPASDCVIGGPDCRRLRRVSGAWRVAADATYTRLRPNGWLRARDAWLDLLGMLLDERGPAPRRPRCRRAPRSRERVAVPGVPLVCGPGRPAGPGRSTARSSASSAGVEAPSNITPPPVASVEQVLDKLVDAPPRGPAACSRRRRLATMRATLRCERWSRSSSSSAAVRASRTHLHRRQPERGSALRRRGTRAQTRRPQSSFGTSTASTTSRSTTRRRRTWR